MGTLDKPHLLPPHLPKPQPKPARKPKSEKGVLVKKIFLEWRKQERGVGWWWNSKYREGGGYREEVSHTFTPPIWTPWWCHWWRWQCLVRKEIKDLCTDIITHCLPSPSSSSPLPGPYALSPTVPTHYTNHHQLTKALFPFILITILTLPKLSTFLTSHSVIFRFLHHSYNCVVIWDLVDFPLDGCFFDIYY